MKFCQDSSCKILWNFWGILFLLGLFVVIFYCFVYLVNFCLAGTFFDQLIIWFWLPFMLLSFEDIAAVSWIHTHVHDFAWLFDSYEKCESVYWLVSGWLAGWLSVRDKNLQFPQIKCQTLHDGSAHRALPILTTFCDLYCISRSQQYQTVLSKNFMFLSD